MLPNLNPTFGAYLAQLDRDPIVAQIIALRRGSTFELRHIDDRDAEPDSLQSVSISELREVARFTDGRAFRPLKSAPNLQAGWRCETANQEELESALNRVYPGASADWLAAQAAPPPVTSYRDFTNRQSGMYRNTAKLDDKQIGEVVNAVCHPRFCLKQRLWMAPGLPEDSLKNKSLIACLEPCALLLECARTTFRMEQKDKLSFSLSPDDARTVQSALQRALNHPAKDVREADFGSPYNPRRIELALRKIESALSPDAGNVEN
ncbi:MAG: DR2241 family protein [Verrucomicrobiia bacterium]|jgi:hypothetical protein